ncbi:gephyrin-like molybdotransferase receptor GlpR [Umezawaea sp.]|uniref:divisome protein SepX/GlpR n=1 Tax=Umezawaea sp. TaxID=1955258 RepID=UPI002ED62326
MPSSLIIVGLVVAWLVVLVPMVARKRTEVARTADSDARNTRAGSTRGSMEEEHAMPDADDDELIDEFEADFDDDYDEYLDDDVVHRPYRPGRGGFDAETARIVAQARYAFRRRVVASMLIAAVVTGLVAGILYPVVWWGHAAVDLALVGYLVYLRRQVRIEEDIRARRQARLAQARRRAAPTPAARPQAEQSRAAEQATAPEAEAQEEHEETGLAPRPRFQHRTRPGTIVVEADDEDPVFVELEGPQYLRYRRAAGE